jgi:VanZ family protein
MSKILNLVFHVANLTLIIFYLYPGSLLGLILYNDSSTGPQATSGSLISLDHFFSFIILSIIGIVAYNKSNKTNILIGYLLLVSIFLELFHLIIPNRSFEFRDLFGNYLAVVLVIISYEIKNRYA